MEPSLAARRIKALLPHISARRVLRFQEVVKSRVADTIVVLENPTDPRNLSACLRTIDALGIQSLATIDRYGGPCDRIATVDKGAGKWLNFRRFRTVADMKLWLKEEQGDPLLFCTNLSKEALPLHRAVEESIREPRAGLGSSAASETTLVPLRPRVALCFGNEHRGVSQSLVEACGGPQRSLYYPQAGFAQSLNLSVACALVTSAFVRRTRDYDEDLVGSLTKGLVSHEAAALAFEEGQKQAQVERTRAGGLDETKAKGGTGGINASGGRRLTADKPGAQIKPFTEQDEACLPQRRSPCPGDRFVTERLTATAMDELLLEMLLTSINNSERFLEKAGLRPKDY